MNTTLATENRHEPSVHLERHPPVRRVGILDRAALHLGVALIKWGRRSGAKPTRERRVNRVELALLHRDRQYALASLAKEQLPVDYVSRLSPFR